MKKSIQTGLPAILLITVITFCISFKAAAQDIIFKPLYKHAFLHNTVESYNNTIHIDLDKKTITGADYDYDLSHADFSSSKYDAVKMEYMLHVKEDHGSAYKTHYWILKMNAQGKPTELTQYISFNSDPAKMDVSFSLTPPVVTANELFTGLMEITINSQADVENLYTLINSGSMKESFNTFKITTDSVIWDFQGNDSVPDFTKRMSIDTVTYTNNESKKYTGFYCRAPDGNYLEIQYGTDENITYGDRDTRRPVILMFVYRNDETKKVFLFMNGR